jgi:hypothetical protein
MDQVFAKIKSHRKNPFFKLVSDHTLFETINVDLDYCITYSPDHNLDEDSWYKVDKFSQQPFCLEILKNNFDSKDYEDLKKEFFRQIAYIFSVQGNDYYFQKISPSLFICRKTIAFGEVAIIEESDLRLVVNKQPDAVYFKDSDTLIFRNLATISSIFKGIDILFKEATNEEVQEFLGESFISLTGEYGVESVSKPNRKRIGLAMTTLAKMSQEDKDSMLSYINDYCKDKLNLDMATEKFKVSKDDELKLLLYGIEQRFYTTPFGKEKRLANSVQPVD